MHHGVALIAFADEVDAAALGPARLGERVQREERAAGFHIRRGAALRAKKTRE